MIPWDAPVMAKDVQVVKLFRAVCLRTGCGWGSGLCDDWAAANDERQAHLRGHRAAQPGEVLL